MRNIGLRIGLVIFAILLGIYAIYPTIRLYTTADLSKQEELTLSKRALHLGLDLKGGMHLMLEVDTVGIGESPQDLRDRAFEIIQNRIDQFGVYEPVIEKQSSGRILVQLPGVDRDRAISLIRKVAHLEFKIVTDERINDVVTKIDRHETKTVAKDLNLEVGNEYNQTVAADKNISVDGNETHDVEGKLEVVIGGDWDVAVTGSARVTIGGNADVTVSGVVNVTGSQINLN